jgi:23S rRNA (uridine2552-2'-O)-methyltransferase
VYRSRSAYKLLEIDDKYRVLRQARTIVDLGAAPGGWSEAAARRTRQNRGRKNQPVMEDDESLDATLRYDRSTSRIAIVAVDLLPIASIPGVHTIQGDFLFPQTQAQVTSVLDGRPVDVVLSDMCENMSGNRDRDSESSLQLCLAAFLFAETHFEQTNRLRDPRRGVLM